MSISKLHTYLKTGQISCTELTKKYLDEISKENLNAYICVTPETAQQTAAKVDEKLAKGEEISLLEGVPMTLKDNISTADINTTCASKILEGYVPIYDATVWKLLKAQNAVLLGKTNMDEFAMGSSCETSYYGGSLNPHSLSHVAGGSSGGVASAVCANLAAYGLGSDTGGSIRQPAAFCGGVGLKPTYGAVSRFGLVAYASSFDQIGPITTCVEDAAMVYDAIGVYDSMDSTSSDKQTPALPTLKDDIKGMRIGVADEFFEGLDAQVKGALKSAIKTYEKLGAQIVEIKLPFLKYALPVYYILACAEASSNLGRYDGIRYGYKTETYADIDEMICKTRSEGFGSEVKRRIMLGTYVLSSGYYDAYYKKAQILRGKIVAHFKQIFEECDVILAPTVPTTAFEKGFSSKDPVQAYMTDICTVPINIAGLPAVSIPCGMDSKNLPIGMQLIGNLFSEANILRAAYAFEQDFGFKTLETGVWL